MQKQYKKLNIKEKYNINIYLFLAVDRKVNEKGKR